MPDFVLSPAERRFLAELRARNVRYLVLGLAAASLQGTTLQTYDIDLWFENPGDPAIAEAARAAGGLYVSGSFGMRPPAIGGEALGDRFDVVTHASGLADFATEDAGAIETTIEGVAVRVLPLERILASKRAAGRPKDLAAIPALEAALAVLRDDGDG